MEERLIKFMKENNFLHNRNSSAYNNAVEKEKKWREIAHKLGKDVKTVKKRWRTLRDTFNKEDQKIKLTGYGMSKGRHWKYYDKMTFLRGSRKKTEIPDMPEDEMCEKIIDFMKENMKIQHKSLYSLEAADDKWDDLAFTLGISVNDTKRRWNILRTEFYKEEQRLNKFGSRGFSFVKFKYYDDLTFLRDAKKIYIDANKLSDSMFEEVILENEDDILDENSKEFNFEEELMTPEKCNGASIKKNKLCEDEYSKFTDDYEYEETMNYEEKSNILEKSAITSFFESMALTVENSNLSISETLKLQMDILNVVTRHITTYNGEKS